MINMFNIKFELEQLIIESKHRKFAPRRRKYKQHISPKTDMCKNIESFKNGLDYKKDSLIDTDDPRDERGTIAVDNNRRVPIHIIHNNPNINQNPNYVIDTDTIQYPKKLMKCKGSLSSGAHEYRHALDNSEYDKLNKLNKKLDIVVTEYNRIAERVNNYIKENDNNSANQLIPKLNSLKTMLNTILNEIDDIKVKVDNEGNKENEVTKKSKRYTN